MSITRGQVWTGFDNASGNTFSLAGSVDTAAGSLIVIMVAYKQGQTTPTLTTPTNFTRLIFHDADMYVYVWNNASVINHSTGVTITNVSGSNTTPRAGVLMEYKSTQGFTLSQDPACISAGAATALATNAITTSGASSGQNVVCVSGFQQTRANTTSAAFSSPTNSYVVTGTVGQNDGVSSIRMSCYDKIITSDVSAETSGVTSNLSLTYSAAVIAYIENAAATWQPYTRNDRFDSLIEQANFAYESRRAMIFLPTGTTPTTWIPLSRKGSWEDIPDDWDD